MSIIAIETIGGTVADDNGAGTNRDDLNGTPVVGRSNSVEPGDTAPALFAVFVLTEALGLAASQPVTAATLRLNSDAATFTGAETMTFRVSAYATASPAAPSTYTGQIAAGKTAASVDYVASSASADLVIELDVADIVNELVELAGWDDTSKALFSIEYLSHTGTSVQHTLEFSATEADHELAETPELTVAKAAMRFSYGQVDTSGVHAIPVLLTVAPVYDETGIAIALRTELNISGRVDTGSDAFNADVIDELYEAMHEYTAPCGIIMRVGNGEYPTGLWFDQVEAMQVLNETWPDTSSGEVAVEDAVFEFTLAFEEPWPVNPEPWKVIARNTTWEFTGDDAGDILDNLNVWERLAVVQTDELTVIGKRLGPNTMLLRPDGEVADELESIELNPTFGWVETVGVRTVESESEWIGQEPPLGDNDAEWEWDAGTTTWNLFEDRCASGYSPFTPLISGTVDGEHTSTPCQI